MPGKDQMRYWYWVDWVCASFLAAVVAVVIGLVCLLILDGKERARFSASSPGKSYQTLVMELGTPTEREAFPDGTEVICWKKFHEASTTYVQSGKVMVPIHNPAYTSGWKAIMRDGVCRRMEEL